MATALSTFITRLRYSLQDTETTYVYSDVAITAWINAGLNRINVEVPFVSANGSLTGMNSVLYAFDLSTIFTTPKLLRVRTITPILAGYKPMTVHPEGMAYIRYLVANGLLVAGTPQHYVIPEGLTVYFDACPAATDVITVDYFAKLTALALAADTPTGLISDGWDSLILNMTKIEIGEDLTNELGKKMKEEAELIVYGDPRKKEPGKLEKFRNWVIADLGRFDNKEAAPYTDFRSGIGSSGATDFTEVY